jgi:glycosyltransferase involved in cell wall biosynthesis
MLKSITRFLPSIQATMELIQFVEPDIVHLNSLVLVPSALGAKLAGVKLVWHIRESVHPGHFGLRRRLLRSLVTRLADEIVFICDQNKQQLMVKRKGVVVNNIVDFTRFDRHLNGLVVREELGLDPSAKVILFLGGMSHIKGAPVFLAALPQVKQQVPELEVIIAAALGPQSNKVVARIARTVLPLVGSGTPRQQFDALLDTGHIRSYAHLLPFSRDPERLMAAADVVVSPFTEPHFGMPVVEAGAMAKPVVASRIGGLEESVVDGQTGLLVSPNDPSALADAIVCVLKDEVLAHLLGEAGYHRAFVQHNADVHVLKIQMIYDRLLDQYEK